MSIKIIGCTDNNIHFQCDTCGLKSTRSISCALLNLRDGLFEHRKGKLMYNIFLIK